MIKYQAESNKWMEEFILTYGSKEIEFNVVAETQ